MEQQINRLNNLLRKHQMDHLSINGQKARLESQMIILLEENNSLRDKLSRSKMSINDQLRAENERLRWELQQVVNRSSAGANNEHLEELYQEIDRLNMFIGEREQNYMQMIGEIQELKKVVAESEAVTNENNSEELKEEIERYKKQSSEYETTIDGLNQQVIKLNADLLLKADFSKKKLNTPNQQMETLKGQNKRLEAELDAFKNNLSLIQPTLANKSQLQCKITPTEPLVIYRRMESGNDLIFESEIESLHDSEWRVKEYEWEKERLKMEGEISKLKSMLYNASSEAEGDLKNQAERYEHHVSLISIELAELKVKLKEMTDANDDEKSQEKLNNDKFLKLEKKLRRAKNTIKQLILFKQKYNDILLLNQTLDEQIKQLKSSLANCQNPVGLSTSTSIPIPFPSNIQSSHKTFTLNQNTELSEQSKEQSGLESKISSQTFNSALLINAQYEKWLILQGKIQRIREENQYLIKSRAVSNYR